MPSPIGHALAGCAVVLGADALSHRRSSAKLTMTCAVLATLPDLDLFAPQYHRTATHSVTAAAIVLIITAVVTGKVSHLRAARYGAQARLRAGRYGGQARWRTAMLCGAAYGSHLLLDWMAVDRFAPAGLQLLWPFSRRFYISGWNVFDQTERLHLFSPATMAQNLRAVAKEIVFLTPIVAGLWLIRVKALARLPSEVARRNHPAK